MRQFSTFKQMLFNSVFSGLTLIQLVPAAKARQGTIIVGSDDV